MDAEQTTFAFTDALYAGRFDEAARHLYPGDLDKLRAVMLACARSLDFVGGNEALLPGLGISREILESSPPQEFGALLMAAAASPRGRLGPFGRVEQTILSVEEHGDMATVLVRTEVVPNEDTDLDPILQRQLGQSGCIERRYQLQRLGGRWFLLFDGGFRRMAERTRNEAREFAERFGRDRNHQGDPDSLECFRLYGYRDPSRRTVIEPRFRDARDFAEGLAAVCFFSHWGYIDGSGRTVIAPRFHDAMDFSEGLAAVASLDPDGEERWGYIDREGNDMIPPRFDGARDFHEERAAVRIGRRWGYIDPRGGIVIDACFELAGDFADGVAEVEDPDEGTVFLDRFGGRVDDPSL